MRCTRWQRAPAEIHQGYRSTILDYGEYCENGVVYGYAGAKIAVLDVHYQQLPEHAGLLHWAMLILKPQMRFCTD